MVVITKPDTLEGGALRASGVRGEECGWVSGFGA
jgi:hypothetical protein